MRQKQRVFSLFLLSPSSRRAWIEIGCTNALCWYSHVALLAEGVDRNMVWQLHFHSVCVALLAEGVDRNPSHGFTSLDGIQSPSSRRAWIEMFTSPIKYLKLSRRPPRGGRG